VESTNHLFGSYGVLLYVSRIPNTAEKYLIRVQQHGYRVKTLPIGSLHGKDPAKWLDEELASSEISTDPVDTLTFVAQGKNFTANVFVVYVDEVSAKRLTCPRSSQTSKNSRWKALDQVLAASDDYPEDHLTIFATHQDRKANLATRAA
jgi:hypothetical protein